MIALEGVRKRFGEVDAVRGVSFQALDGTVTGLLGPNGAGKTTTLRMLSGLMQPDTGTIHVDGADVVADPIGAQRFMALLPDSRGLYPRMTAREHIRYFGELRGLTAAALDRQTERLIRRLGLEPLAGRRVPAAVGPHVQRAVEHDLSGIMPGPRDTLAGNILRPPTRHDCAVYSRPSVVAGARAISSPSLGSSTARARMSAPTRLAIVAGAFHVGRLPIGPAAASMMNDNYRPFQIDRLYEEFFERGLKYFFPVATVTRSSTREDL